MNAAEHGRETLLDRVKPYEDLYLSRRGSPLWGNSPGRLVAGLIASMSPCVVLDAGCGDGKNAIHLERAGFDVIGFDHSPTAIAALNDRFQAAGVPLRGSYSVADACDFSLTAPAVDVLVSYGLYHCLPTAERLEAHMRLQGLVRPGGLVLFCSLTDGIPMASDHMTRGIVLPSVEEVLGLWAGFSIHEHVVEQFEDIHHEIVPKHSHEALWVVASRLH